MEQPRSDVTPVIEWYMVRDAWGQPVRIFPDDHEWTGPTIEQMAQSATEWMDWHAYRQATGPVMRWWHRKRRVSTPHVPALTGYTINVHYSDGSMRVWSV